MSIIWEEPTIDSRGAGVDHSNLEAALRANPTKWAILGENVSASTPSAAKKSVQYFNPAEHFEFKVRGVVNNKAAKVYARYIGPITEAGA